MSARKHILTAVVATGLLLAVAVAAQAAPEKTAEPPAEPAPYSGETVRDVTDKPGKDKTDAPNGLPGLADFLRMILWLAVLIVFIYVAVWLIRKYVPSARGSFAPGALKVVSRAHVSARQSILLVKAGERFVVVGVTPGSMTRLTEITDPEEARRLTEDLASQHGAAGSFRKALSKAGDVMSADDAAPADAKGEGDVREVRQELDAVRRKVNWWRGQTKT